MSSLEGYRDVGLLIARMGFGLSFFWFHGYPKLVSGPDGWERFGRAMSNVGITFGYEWWGLLAALSESVGGLLFAFGLFFRPACLALLGVMTFATIEQYARDTPVPEHAFKNAFIFAGMFLIGPGRHSLDARPWGKGRRR
ncbi:MAG TPA: DoxX family protein [Vicinamibacterales bacterium]